MVAFKTLRALNASYASVVSRINGSPGKPVANPTPCAWQIPESVLAQHSSETAPEDVDVLIIGSGITACSIAYHLLRGARNTSKRGQLPRVAILEARELCSGATGRNGGHLKETPYQEWGALVKKFGRAAADEVVRFRMAHLQQLLGIAESEGIKEIADARLVETTDVYCEPEAWTDAKQKLRAWLEAFPDEKGKWKIWEGAEVKTNFSLSTAVGVITGPAGALSSYRLITSLYAKLLEEFPTLSIDCNTPIETLQGTPLDQWRRPIDPVKPYSCFTYKGSSREIRATHVVHATNGYVSRLLPGFKGKIIPMRGQMTCQSLLPSTTALPGGENRSWSFIWKKGFDYMTVTPEGHYMLGGGWARGTNDGLDAVANCRDDENAVVETAYLSGLLTAMFPGLVRGVQLDAAWTGVLGYSVDSVPWVGEVPEKAAGGRRRGTGKEWVCAGYSGEGMVNAWGCGSALASMLRNELYGEKEVVGLPSVMLVTEKRLKKATLEMMAEDYI
ncbi:FAD dependent oxidoreductase [Sphaerosporella brunnea]|uniref:FAD dependent oxidoreductase n=1 Tax=Sphaerosporella brunnea TaxID=1250544 RepID=A0A5J5F7F6_9PEZI|nr:FAD dependent oxidoreductase [Sphaerosporella brunnea]